MTKGLTLDNLCELIVDCEHKTAPLALEGYPSIRTPNVGRGRLRLEGVNRVDETTYSAWTRRAQPQANDLIIAREAPVGNVAIIRPGQKVCLGQRTVLVRPDPKRVNPDYLTYFLLGDYVQNRFRSVSLGSTVAHLNMSDIRNLPLPTLPSMPAQSRIAAILSAYDDLIENNVRRIAILEDMARSLFEEWFVYRRPSHPFASESDWVEGTIGDAFTLQRGFDLPASDRIHGPYPVVAASGVHGFHSEYKVRGPGVTTGRSGTIGQFQFIQEDFWPLNTSLWIKEFKHGGPIFAYYLLSSLNMSGNNTGAAVPSLNRNIVHAMPTTLPPLPLVNAFEGIVSDMRRTVSALTDSNANLRPTRDLLLPKLISGEIEARVAEEALETAAA